MRGFPPQKSGGLIEPILIREAFGICGMEMFGPLPSTKKGNKYGIVCTNYWAQIKAVPGQTAIAVANFLVTQVILRHGASITNFSVDNLPVFQSQNNQKVFKVIQTICPIGTISSSNTSNIRATMIQNATTSFH